MLTAMTPGQPSNFHQNMIRLRVISNNQDDGQGDRRLALVPGSLSSPPGYEAAPRAPLSGPSTGSISCSLADGRDLEEHPRRVEAGLVHSCPAFVQH